MSKRERLQSAVVALVLLVGCTLDGARDAESTPAATGLQVRQRTFATNDPVERACALEPTYLTRIWRGTDPERSGDILMVPQEPNFFGTSNLVSHSGPWDYLQEVPLVLYGPKFVARRGEVDTRVSIPDVFPTIGALTGVDLPRRDGAPLGEALAPDTDPPRLIVVIVWDGAGRNTLDRWPERWPTLRSLSEKGVSYLRATVGSSPSVTSSIHASLGTGAFPRRHGVSGNWLRQPDGGVLGALWGRDTSALRLSTFADEVDRSFGNASSVGALAWLGWHLAMVGRGSAAPGGDADEVGLIKLSNGETTVSGNNELFTTDKGLAGAADIDALLGRLDRSDGEADGRWHDENVSIEEVEGTWPIYWNPAWARYQGDLALQFLAEGGYGLDATPDLFLTNFKMTDLAGHAFTYESPQYASALQAQDEQLRRIVEYLDEEVRGYVIVLTADHGHTPSPRSTGAWPISQRELLNDIDEHFKARDSSLIEESDVVSLFLDPDVRKSLDVTADDIARYINSYTLADNLKSKGVPARYEERLKENLFSAAFPKDALPEVMRCAFGRRPLNRLDA
jgi:predicted AlkP superfamily pyrophosphatase or phosphodiesterase